MASRSTKVIGYFAYTPQKTVVREKLGRSVTTRRPD
jgi:hypothetical protein